MRLEIRACLVSQLRMPQKLSLVNLVRCVALLAAPQES